MKRIFSVAIVILGLFLLTGCFEKDFAADTIVLRGAKTLDFQAGDAKTVTAQLSQLDTTPTLTAVSNNDDLAVSLSADNILTLTSHTQGEYIVTLRLEAKGYNPLEVKYPVSVTLKEMTAKISVQQGEMLKLSEPLVLNKDATLLLALSSLPEGAAISVKNADSTIVSAVLSGNTITLSALAPGKTTLSVSAECAGYTPFIQTMSIEVEKIAALLNLSQQNISGTTLQTLQFTVTEYQPGGQISVATSDAAVNATLNGNVISVSSVKAGSFSVTVSCSAADYNTTTKTASAIFTMPAVPFSAPSSASVTVGKSSSFALTGYPSGTTFTVTTSNGTISAQQDSGNITITGNRVGNATLTVTARCAGYAESKLTISATVNAVAISVSSQYSSYVKQVFDLTNQERVSHGLSKLAYISELDAASQLRAKEASLYWAHTRPDGRSWETVLADMGVDYASAGENLFASNSLDAQLAVDSWMNSEGHRANILRAEFTGISIGIYKGSDGDYYFAQIFITR